MGLRQVTLVIVPHSGGRIIERRFSVFALKLLAVLAVILIFAAVAAIGFAVRVHVRQQDYQSLRRRNRELVEQNARIRQLETELGNVRREHRRIQEILGIELEPPPLAVESLYRSLGDSAGGGLLAIPDSSQLPVTRSDRPHIPGIAPLARYEVSREFGPGHTGVDMVAETGTPVYATADGTVDFAGWDTIYGNSLRIRHLGRIETFYGHLHRIYRLAGDSVSQGAVIGLVGSTGRSTAPHLHYEITRNRRPQNPVYYLR
jgi:murein DD-endopeptidase MepM/ murein hydrolase activator NlpD